MNVSLYQAAAALNANSEWQDVIAENLASSGVSGFKKQSLATSAVQAGLMSSDGTAPQHFYLPQTSVSTSFQNGELNYTGDNRNVGIEGKGFFQIQLAHGTPAVTRDGEFRVSAKGQLVTKEGYQVMSDANTPIQLDPANHDPIFIARTGQVSQGAVVKGKLGVTDFENPQLLTATNGVYFLATNPHLVAIPATGTLCDGFVEGANTTSLGEMANMMTAQRAFEANQKVIQIQDDRMSKAITELGNPS